MQPLTPTAIARARSDKALQARLGQELTRLIGPGPASTGLSRFAIQTEVPEAGDAGARD